MPLKDVLARAKLPDRNPRREPVWKGPEIDGVTQSMLGRFLACRERFRLTVVEGWKAADTFNHRIEYGNLWHAAEETLAACTKPSSPAYKEAVEKALLDYARTLAQKYPMQRREVEHWFNVCRVQFPVYVEFWKKQQDVVDREPLEQEGIFDVLYELPSGKKVRLRGKRDAVDLIGRGRDKKVFVQENKTKSDISESQIRRQLGFDLQSMLYLVTWDLQHPESKYPLGGVRYNVVRRPLSGGKGTIVQHKPSKKNPQGETPNEFYARLQGIISESPQEFFARWRVDLGPTDLENFRKMCLNPLLEDLCDWWNHVENCRLIGKSVWDSVQGVHWVHPYGVRNPLDEGGSSDLDEYLFNGSTVGLQRVENLFPEL